MQTKTRQNKTSNLQKALDPEALEQSPLYPRGRGREGTAPRGVLGRRAPARDALPALRFPLTVQPRSRGRGRNTRAPGLPTRLRYLPQARERRKAVGDQSVSIRCANQHPRNQGLTTEPHASRGLLSASMRRALCSLCV